MEYNRMIAISGMPGLFELVSSKNEGAVVKSLEDETVKFVSSRVHNFSHLESIEIYTVRDNVNLIEVLKAMELSSEAIPSDKDAAAVKAYMEKVYPEMDFDRVYSSDMKKMVKWYGILKANDVEIKSTEPVTDEEEGTSPDQKPVAETLTPETAPAEEDVPAKKAPPKKKKAAPSAEMDFDAPAEQ
ncbi:MAG: DUF5606 domain-containing protein [Chitinophagaceae bacterium]